MSPTGIYHPSTAPTEYNQCTEAATKVPATPTTNIGTLSVFSDLPDATPCRQYNIYAIVQPYDTGWLCYLMLCHDGHNIRVHC
jgi:hypothetical protein